jgi:hypothetical protein
MLVGAQEYVRMVDTNGLQAREGDVTMPQWLCHQLERAFMKKDRRQIRLLNDCWYFYRTKQTPDSQESVPISHP